MWLMLRAPRVFFGPVARQWNWAGQYGRAGTNTGGVAVLLPKTAPGGCGHHNWHWVGPKPPLSTCQCSVPPCLAGEGGPQGAPGDSLGSLDPHPVLLGGHQEGRGDSPSQTDRWTEQALAGIPAPLSSQGRPESAGLRPEAGLAAATVTNWRVAIGQHIVFHSRLHIPLRPRLSPLAQTRLHLEKQEVCAGSRLPAGQPALALCPAVQ